MDEAGWEAHRRAEREYHQPHHRHLADVTPIRQETRDDGGGGGGNFEDPNYIPPDSEGARTDGHRQGFGKLQFMCGPMLRYDTTITTPSGLLWLGFCMIVTSDSYSSYNPPPVLLLRPSGTQQPRVIPGVKLYTYQSSAGGNTFWRFKMEVPLVEGETQWWYAINGGRELSFWVPGRSQNMRWVAHSCNGFSAGVDRASFNGPDPLWDDVLRQHASKPLHCLVGGGDQIYSDPVMLEPEMEAYIKEDDPEKKKSMPLTEEMSYTMDRYYFNSYCNWFRTGAFGRAISCIPMLNIADDHDCIDGWGSYPDDLQLSPVFNAAGRKTFFWYLLFQCFIVSELDGTAPPPARHTFQSAVIGGEAPYIPFPSLSFFSYLGPKARILMLDCRAERKKNRICSEITYQRVFDRVNQLPPEVEHLVVLLGVPIAYPRMNFLETALDSKINPLVMLGKAGTMGLSGFVNKFNKEAELLDDLNDHWTAKDHKAERNWLIEQCQQLAGRNRLRVTFLSGDVHAAACGKFFDTKKVDPPQDPKYMLNIITSAIVNTPPPPPVITMVNKLATKRHKTLHHIETDETMEPLFAVDTDGKNLRNKWVLGRRNYSTVEYNPMSGDLEFTYKVEITKGGGQTKDYPISTPAPRWS